MHTYYGMDRIVVTTFWIIYDIQVPLCVVFCEICIHPRLQRSIKTLDNDTLYVRIVSCVKIYSLKFQVLLERFINKFSLIEW